MRTELLDVLRWDVILDADGNEAVATAPYSVAQDVASACRTFRGEVYYNTTLGVPYIGQILGKEPSNAFVKAQLEAAAAAVPGCNNPQAFITGLSGRQLTGQVQFTDDNGAVQVAGF